MVLFRPSGKAVDYCRDSELEFRFRLIKLWEYPAYEFLAKTRDELLRLVHLMQGGLELTKKAEERIYESDPRNKLDLLTVFGILLGLRDKSLTRAFFKRRRDIMVRSPMYEWILEEGIEKGLEKGKAVGEYQKAIATAQAMLLEGEPTEKIARVTGLTPEEVAALGNSAPIPDSY